MKFVQHKDGSCDIMFSFKEKLLILRKGKLHLSDEHLRHFGNNLMKIVMDWNFNFNEKVKNLQTNIDTKIESK